MGILIFVWVLIWCLKNAVADVAYAVQGKTPPRYKLRMQEAQRAGTTVTRPRYGTREYFADLRSDALEARTARRRARARRKARARAEAERAESRHPEPAAAPPPQPTRPLPEPRPAPDVQPPPPPPVQPEPTRPTPDDGPDAQVIPLFPVPTPKEDDVTTTDQPTTDQPNAEITGLQSAIAYARGVAAAHEQHSLAAGELFLGSLSRFGVTGQTIQVVAEAQEASATAAGNWRTAATKLAEQLVVKEAYDAVPDAGDRPFVQGE